MEYKQNSMEAAMRCITFTLAGDKKVSEEEIAYALNTSENLENWYANPFRNLFKDMFAGMFGEADEDEQEDEEEIVFEAISEEVLLAITKDVLSKISKCDNAADLKAYAALCASSVTDEDIAGQVIRFSLYTCGADTLSPWVDVGIQPISTHIEKNEIRNTKYMASALNIDYKSFEESYLDGLTFYNNSNLEEGETVILDESEVAVGENSAAQILKIGLIATGSDCDFSMGLDTFLEAYFMISCNIARSKGEKTIKMHTSEALGEVLIGLFKEFQGQLDSEATENFFAMDHLRAQDNEEDLPWNPEYDAAIEGFSEAHHALLKEELKLITDTKLRKITYQMSYLLTKADADENYGYQVINHLDIFSGEVEQDKLEITGAEQASLDIIAEHFNFDEDQLYGMNQKLEDGHYGSL